jgi:hypothetical protein
MQTVISENLVHSHFQLVVVIHLVKFSSQYCLLGCDAIYSGREVPAFLMKVPVQCRCHTTHCHENLRSHRKFSADMGPHASLTGHILTHLDPTHTFTTHFNIIFWYVMRSYIVCVPHQILLEWSSHRGWDGHGMQHTWDTREVQTEYC